MKRDVPTHYLRTNHREWSPAHVVYLDTETRPEIVGDAEVHRLRCWVARTMDRRPRPRCKTRDVWHRGTTADQLADVVEAFATGQKATWLFAHNLGFDLTVTGLLDVLAGRGWTLGRWSTAGASPWFRLNRDGHSLALTDSVSWLQKSMEQVAPLVGLDKVALPDPGDDLEVWLERCSGDVAILAEAMNQLMDWWDTAKVGNWTITGNGCGWNAMRHMTPPRSILVRTGDGGAEMERTAIYGGRRDATRWGELKGGPFVTVDFTDAYPTICANLRLPAARLTPFDGLPLDCRELQGGMVEILARVEVEVTSPRYPLRDGGATWYPVGRFWTTLAGPEIRDALDRGELRAIGAGFRYRVDGHLSRWARWVMDLAAGRVAGAPAVATLPAKRWGRSVPGRFAQRVGVPARIGLAESVGWGQVDGWNVTAGTGSTVVDVAGDRWYVTRDTDADDCFPAVLAWVESHCRVRLNRMLDWLGPACWAVCNTDGAVIDLGQAPHGRPAPRKGALGLASAVKVAAGLCDDVAALTWPLVPRPKDSYSTAWVAGPQTMILDGEAKLSGVAKGSRRLDDGTREALLWPGIAWQMANGDRSGYVRPLQRYSVPAVTVQRWALDDGRAVPPVALGGGLVPCLAGYLAPGEVVPVPGRLADVQARAVHRLAGPGGDVFRLVV